jgi:hypothetical protein
MMIHVCPKCASYKHHIIDDFSITLKEVDVIVDTAGRTKAVQTLGPVATIELVIASDIDHMRKLKTATFQEISETDTQFTFRLENFFSDHDVTAEDQHIGVIGIFD